MAEYVFDMERSGFNPGHFQFKGLKWKTFSEQVQPQPGCLEKADLVLVGLTIWLRRQLQDTKSNAEPFEQLHSKETVCIF